MIEFRRESKFRNETDPQIELLDKSDEKSKFSNPQIDSEYPKIDLLS